MYVYINLSRNRYGGRLYESQLVEQLIKSGEEVKEVNLMRYNSMIANALYMIWVWIRYKFFFRGNMLLTHITCPFAGVFAKSNTVIVHHIDHRYSPLSSKILLYAAERYMQSFKAHFHKVITVSTYWENYFKSMGFGRVETIYNTINIVPPTTLQVDAFKKCYGLDDGRPIIYLGNDHLAKGAHIAYHALKGIDAHFVTSGKKYAQLPCLNLELAYADYLLLLKSASMAVLWSQLQEGWNRTAHEALLLGTPVLGSGAAGMKELLQHCEQPHISGAHKLEEWARKCLINTIPIKKDFLLSLNEQYLDRRINEVFKC